MIIPFIIFYDLYMSDYTVAKAPQHWNVSTRINHDLDNETLALQQREILLSTKNKADWVVDRSPILVKRIDPSHITMFSEKYTTINVFSAGFCHIRNLYLFKGTFYIVTPDSKVTTTIFGHEFRTLDCFPIPNVNIHCITFTEFTRLFSNKLIQWQQTTIFAFQDNNLLGHYFHFVEDLVGIWLVYRAALESGTTNIVVPRLVFPGVSAETIRGNNFGNSESINMFLLQEAFDNPIILDDGKWRKESSWNLTQIESAIIGSRKAAHAGDMNVQQANKMTLGICHVLWNPSRINALKSKILNSVRLNHTSSALDRPLILYIDRQPTRRRLNHSIHQHLLKELNRLQSEGWEVRVQKMEQLTFAEQMILASHADVIIGVHGNGLTHGLWAPTNGGMIEIQPRGKRHFDYEWIAQISGLKYASVDIDGVEWVGKYERPQGIMNDNNIKVDVELIGKIIRTWKDGPHKSTWQLAHLF